MNRSTLLNMKSGSKRTRKLTMSTELVFVGTFKRLFETGAVELAAALALTCVGERQESAERMADLLDERGAAPEVQAFGRFFRMLIFGAYVDRAISRADPSLSPRTKACNEVAYNNAAADERTGGVCTNYPNGGAHGRLPGWYSWHPPLRTAGP